MELLSSDPRDISASSESHNRIGHAGNCSTARIDLFEWFDWILNDVFVGIFQLNAKARAFFDGLIDLPMPRC